MMLLSQEQYSRHVTGDNFLPETVEDFDSWLANGGGGKEHEVGGIGIVEKAFQSPIRITRNEDSIAILLEQLAGPGLDKAGKLGSRSVRLNEG